MVADEISKLSTTSIVVAAEDKLSADLTGEAVILDLGSGVYYGLDSIGARIWELIKEPRSVNSIRDVMLAEYDVETERCTEDILSLLEQMASKGLIQIRDEKAS